MTVVLRRGHGDALEIVDSAGALFAAKLLLDGDSARARLEAALTAPRPPALRITLAQAIPKGQKMDFVVEKATELGVAAILPFAGERTVGDGAREGKLERWRRLAKAAAQQCGRADVPEVAAATDVAGVAGALAAFDVALIPWELAPAVPLRERLPQLLGGARTVVVAIGPEGGLSHAEAGVLERAGGHLVSLGSRVFRTETAGLVACSALLYESGDV